MTVVAPVVIVVAAVHTMSSARLNRVLVTKAQPEQSMRLVLVLVAEVKWQSGPLGGAPRMIAVVHVAVWIGPP